MKEFEVVVIGGGTAGLAAAQSARGKGVSVALVESGRPGGHSLFKGQLPLQILRERMDSSGQRLSMEQLILAVDAKGKALSNEVIENLKTSGIEWIPGEGMLTRSRQVTVRQENDSLAIKAKSIVIATGSQVKPEPTVAFDEESIFPIDALLDWNETPDSILIAGGDKTGLEAAQLFCLLGSRVFLVDGHDRLIHDQDPELITALEAGFKAQKIKVLLQKKIVSIFKGTEKIEVTLDGGVKFSTDKILRSGERMGNVEGLDLGLLGIETGNNKEIWINEHMETSVKGVYAAGSVTGHPRSAQISEEEGRAAGLNAAGGDQPIQRDHIYFCLQTQPPLASIGCRSDEAHYKGFRAVEGRFKPSDSVDTHNVYEGICKIVADRESRKIIGAQITGALAAPSIAMIQSQMQAGATVKELTAALKKKTSSFLPIVGAAKECLRALSVRR